MTLPWDCFSCSTGALWPSPWSSWQDRDRWYESLCPHHKNKWDDDKEALDKALTAAAEKFKAMTPEEIKDWKEIHMKRPRWRIGVRK